jgi:hypothetical protein
LPGGTQLKAGDNYQGEENTLIQSAGPSGFTGVHSHLIVKPLLSGGIGECFCLVEIFEEDGAPHTLTNPLLWGSLVPSSMKKLRCDSTVLSIISYAHLFLLAKKQTTNQVFSFHVGTKTPNLNLAIAKKTP